MNIIADLHTHTNVSNHAFNTLTEMARRAGELGLYALAVTDHAPSMPDAPHPWYFYNLKRLPDKIEGVWLLKGAEVNVRGVEGALDFTPEEMARLRFDWVVASIHSVTVGADSLTEDEATQLWLNIAANPFVDCIGHSESSLYRYDYDAVTKVFAQNNKVVEMNANSAVVRPGNERNMRALACACKRNGTLLAVNSDAHSIYNLAVLDTVLPMLREIAFPPELVVNASRENLLRTLKAHGKPIAARMEAEEPR